ncbi:tyrosine-protein phosphatase non-receptor type substrate 1-like [Heterodontus francisci]|uniref:tyrosine-protein phosphatase non-receptor type substrate 1-like n=1 Tax=Heterodontus francisci TaxID=7792 RepID=UPI00355C534F
MKNPLDELLKGCPPLRPESSFSGLNMDESAVLSFAASDQELSICKMSVRATVQCMVVLGMVWPAAKVTSNKVDQFPKFLKVVRGASVSMRCTFPLFQDTPDVYWWKRGEESFLEPDSRKRFNVKKGSSSFGVLNASVADSGMYYCKVKHQESIGDGSGSQLTVYVPPTPLKIVPIERISATTLKLECKTAAFYPEHLGISWLRDGVEILSGIETVKNKSAEGLYEVSSFLEEVQTAPEKVVYTCLASHISLLVPASVSYIVNQGKERLVISASAAQNSMRAMP